MNKILHILRLALSYELKLSKPLNPPYQYNIEPTNICNFKCVFCPQSDPEHQSVREQGYLTVEKLKMFLKQIKKLKPGNRNISLTLDGEPTLNKNLPEFIRIINDENLFPRFSTNAKNLSPVMVDKLGDAGSFLVSVDFASNARYFENVRGGDGDFEVILENLRYLVKRTREKSGIKLEVINISHYSGADPEKSLSDMKNMFKKDLLRHIVFGSREFHNFCGHLEINPKSNYLLCPYPWTSFNVTWEGDVVPCCRDTRARTILGNVFKQNITDIWYGDNYQSLRKKLTRKDVFKIASCKNCDLPWSSGTKRWKPKYILSSLLRR